jgi:ABC-type uncharacterized transport system permease subunit
MDKNHIFSTNANKHIWWYKSFYKIWPMLWLIHTTATTIRNTTPITAEIAKSLMRRPLCKNLAYENLYCYLRFLMYSFNNYFVMSFNYSLFVFDDYLSSNLKYFSSSIPKERKTFPFALFPIPSPTSKWFL